MSERIRAREGADNQEVDGRRRELRALLVAAASTARQVRRVQAVSGQIGRTLKPVRERVSMLLSAAG